MSRGARAARRPAFKESDIKKMLKSDSSFAIKEAYSSIRTKLMFVNTEQRCPVYAISSPYPYDGKTITCVNLAISFAAMGKKTLIIDADMRNPAIHRFFGSALENGVSEILAGLESNIDFETTTIPALKYLNAGKIPPNPAELLSGCRLDKLIEVAKEHFDYIFIDTPPVCGVTDASILAKKVTGCLLVIREGKSDIQAISRTVGTLEQVGADIVGFILNGINPRDQGIYRHEFPRSPTYLKQRAAAT